MNTLVIERIFSDPNYSYIDFDRLMKTSKIDITEIYCVSKRTVTSYIEMFAKINKIEIKILEESSKIEALIVICEEVDFGIGELITEAKEEFLPIFVHRSDVNFSYHL